MLTANDYIDEVKLNLARIDVANHLSNQLILTFVNQARRYVQNMVMDLVPERYSRKTIISLNYGNIEPDLPTNVNSYQNNTTRFVSVILPDDFIDMINVHIHARPLYWASLPPMVKLYNTYEARRLREEEMWNVQLHSWNTPSLERPAYVVTKDLTTNNNILRVAGLYGNTMMNNYDLSFDPFCTIWFKRAIEDLENFPSDDNDMTTPPDCINIVIQRALIDCLNVINSGVQIGSLTNDLQVMEQSIVMNYQTNKNKEEILLPSKEGL